jgi:diadenosine tetraphosphate (Ap4A) HIT family hydrolase
MNGSKSSDCPFCDVPPERVVDGTDLALVVEDAFPVSPGHTLILPRRHVPSYFDLSAAELMAVSELLLRAQRRLATERSPSGFNVGINVGDAAGQTVMHAHVHLIPRYRGDVVDPQGGVRNVIPGRGRYSRAVPI